jgi:hypothetical protein
MIAAARGLALCIVSTVALAVCARESPSDTSAIDGAARGAPAPMADAARLDAASGIAIKEEAPAAQLPTAAQTRDSVAPAMIIRNGSVSIEVDSLEVAMAAVRALAARLGGFIGNVSVASGEYQVRSATLEMKIPAPHFDEAMSGMTPLGKVEGSTATAEDVGEEFVDVSARVANAKRLETRLVDLLATRTGKLDDVLAVERELARVREEIERYEGRIRYLRSRVAVSTISVTVHEKAPLVSPNPGTSVISEAFVNMWRNFVRFIAGLIESLGVIVPVAALVGVAFLGWRRWRRKA